jgi:hypothetical protein
MDDNERQRLRELFAWWIGFFTAMLEIAIAYLLWYLFFGWR